MSKILFLVDYPLDGIGGAEKSTIIIAKLLSENGFSVKVLSPKLINQKNDFNFAIVYWKKRKNKLINVFSRIAALRRAIKSEHPNYIHSQFSQYGAVLCVLKRLHLIPKTTKCFFTDRHYWNSYTRKYKFLFKKTAFCLDTIICTTQANAENWKKINKRNNVVVINNILEPLWYNFDYSKKLIEKECNGFSKDDFLVGFAGRYIWWKNWNHILSLCASLLEIDNVKFAFVITGEPNSGKDLYIRDVKELLGDRVKVLEDADIHQMDSFYYMIDCFLVASTEESFGRTLLEAASRKNVIIGTNSGGVPEVIKKESNLFEVGDIQRAKKIILSYINDKALYETDSLYFYNSFLDHYSEEDFKKKTISLYN